MVIGNLNDNSISNKFDNLKLIIQGKIDILVITETKTDHTPYITKTLRKAIMRRSQLETKYLKTKTQTDLKLYKKHKNFCSKLYQRERRKYYDSLDMKNIKNFGKR